MPKDAITKDSDFAFSRLHGLWASSVQGPALRRLIACATEENLARALAEYGIQAGSHFSFHRYLVERQLLRLNEIQAWAVPGLSCLFG